MFEFVMHNNKRNTPYFCMLRAATKIKNSNTIKRLICTIIMLILFVVVLKLNRIYIIVFIYCVQTQILKEITNITDIKKKGFYAMKLINWYFIVVAHMYFIGKTIGGVYISKIPNVISKHHHFFCFTAYIAGIIIFITSLDRKNLKQQFASFAISHFLISTVSFCSNYCVLNVLKGKMWFVYPTLLVVTNDVFAYVFGKLYGKRPLISLSPKKTWEGFIGGFVCTFAVGMILAYLKANYGFCPDHNDRLLLSSKELCISRCTVAIRMIYLHAMSFVIFASFIAPFGGFFASGIKRAFKVKDFSDTIPGHGGFADRFDCQLLMGIFTNVYYYTFIYEKIVTKETIFNMIKANLARNEIIELSEMIRNELLNAN